ncbi:hypothetical protein ABK040_005120 [Willaertia magna]
MSEEQQLKALVERLEKVANRLESIKVSGAGSTGETSGNAEAPQVEAFNSYLSEHFQPLINTLNTIGGDCEPVTKLLNDAMNQLKLLITCASKYKKPTDEVFVSLLTPLDKIMKQIGDLRFKKFKSEQYNHLYALEEGMKCILWPTSPTPVSFVKEMVNAAQFYTNKVLMTFKNTDKAELHKTFVNQLKQSIEELANYVKEYHMSGLAWNVRASEPASANSLENLGSTPTATTTTTPAPTTTGGSFAPPPPTKIIKVDVPPPTENTSSSASANLFAEIASKRDNAGAGLKHVTKDMKTKNQKDKVSVVSGDNVKKSTTTSVTSKTVKGTPKFQKISTGMGQKWEVYHQDGAHDLKITDTDLKHTVYIYGCNDTLITIEGKVNTITMDKCTKTGVIFNSVVSSVELVNCKSCQVQNTGVVPTISVDKTDGFQLYLSKESMHTCRIITSKSSEMNVSVPTEDDEDVVEIPLPEQYVHTIDPKTGKIVTETIKHE